MDKRIHIVTGHYGSGKTEFSMNYALFLKELYENVAIVDLDIINYYFRTREKTEYLEKNGIEVYSSSRGHNDTLDLPALDAGILKPIQDKKFQTVLDVGGNPQGAIVLRTYTPYLVDTDNMFVINANRPETSNATDTIAYLRQVESRSGIKINTLINTTHMLKYTTKDDVIKGHELVSEVSEILGLEFRYNVCQKDVAKDLIDDPEVSSRLKNRLFPIDLYFRDDWMS